APDRDGSVVCGARLGCTFRLAQDMAIAGDCVFSGDGFSGTLSLEAAPRESGFLEEEGRDLKNIVALHLSPPEVAATWVPHLARMDRLTGLQACGGAFGNAELATVGRLPLLRSLTLRG